MLPSWVGKQKRHRSCAGGPAEHDCSFQQTPPSLACQFLVCAPLQLTSCAGCHQHAQRASVWTSWRCLRSVKALRRFPACMQGVDVVWETVGGKMFDTCAKNLAVGGRLLVIGMMSQYSEGWPASQVCACPACLDDGPSAWSLQSRRLSFRVGTIQKAAPPLLAITSRTRALQGCVHHLLCRCLWHSRIMLADHRLPASGHRAA